MEAVGTTNLGRRRFGPEEQVGSPNLGDFLRIKQDENCNSGRTNFSGQTLDSISRLERNRGPGRAQSNRTLLDIIRDDTVHQGDSSRNSWRDFTNRLRIRLQGSDSDPIDAPAPDAPTSSRVVTPGNSTRLNASISVGSDHPQADSSSSAGEGAAAEPVRMSLMALLAETDRQMGLNGSAFLMETEDGEEEEEEEEVAEKSGSGWGREHKCCVCMLRRKGAAFIPCGHTFCRLCTRELWVQRGHCPLCNTLILEILDIF